MNRYGLIVGDVVVQVRYGAPGTDGVWLELPPDVSNGVRLYEGSWSFPPSGGHVWTGSGWELSAEALAQRTADLKEHASSCRDAKLSSGFDYDFGDARGIHSIGTTAADRVGWLEVKAVSDAMIQMVNPAGVISIRTDTGDIEITAQEWPSIQVAAGVFGQPIWAASWLIKDEIEAGTIVDQESIDNHPAWPV